MAKRKPLIDEDGEVRELTLEDFEQFRPVEEVLSPELLAKIKIHNSRPQQEAVSETLMEKIAGHVGYNTKQLGDAGEMLVAAQLTLHGVPAYTVPTNWPGYDVAANRRGSSRPETISVKTRTSAKIHSSVSYDCADEFAWLAIVILDNKMSEQQHDKVEFIAPRIFIVPREIADQRSWLRDNVRGWPLRRIYEFPNSPAAHKRAKNAARGLADYEGNFTLSRDPVRIP